jgi:hypothetical protein
LLSRDFFEAGLETTEGDLVGTTNHGEAIKFFFRNVVTGDNHFRDGILFEDSFYRINRPEYGITIHLFALISKIIIDKTNGFQA